MFIEENTFENVVCEMLFIWFTVTHCIPDPPLSEKFFFGNIRY